MHRLGDIGRTKVDNDCLRLIGFVVKKAGLICRLAKRSPDRLSFQMEIKITRPGNLHPLTPLAQIHPGLHGNRQVARIHFPLLGQAHQRVTLVVAKYRVTGPNQDPGQNRIRQFIGNGGLQRSLYFKVKHVEPPTNSLPDRLTNAFQHRLGIGGFLQRFPKLRVV